MMTTKDDRRQRFEHRKAKHVRDIRRKDYICNERDAVTYGAGDSHNDGERYNVMNARHSRPITRGGGHVTGNPRYRDSRHREQVEV